LPYLDNPPAVLKRLASHVRPGGVIAFMEFDVTRIGSVPEAPLFHAMASWIADAFKGSGIDPAVGSSLGRVFRDAGLPWPNIIRLGLATADEVGIDSLESRLCEEATSSKLTAFSPRWVSAWVRVPLQ
jgi:hypothetical protein